jgi:hypothetical protein
MGRRTNLATGLCLVVASIVGPALASGASAAPVSRPTASLFQSHVNANSGSSSDSNSGSKKKWPCGPKCKAAKALAAAIAAKQAAHVQYLLTYMPGGLGRKRDDLSLKARTALNYLMRTDNAFDPQYLALRKVVTDELADRTGYGQAQMNRAWKTAPRAHQIAALAELTQLGVKYVVGMEDPNLQLDCSGLQWFAWRVAGVDMPRQAVSQMDHHMRVDRKDAIVGDIVGQGTHVHLYLGVGNLTIHAPYAGLNVELRDLPESQASTSIFADPSKIAGYRL